MIRERLVEWLSWSACAVILLALLIGLDPYRRPPMRYGYGPDRHEYFIATIARARELQETGAYRTRPNEKWLLRGGWADASSRRNSRQALAEQRRVRLILPVLDPKPVQIRLRLKPLPSKDGEPVPTELEYGVNGTALNRFVVPPEGAVLKFRVEPSMLHRGDNVIYLYRVTRRKDSLPWLSLGWMNARLLENGD